MNFNSGAFLLFLPVVTLVHWLLPSKLRWVWLLCASYYFYMYWDPKLVVLLLATTLVSYGSALAMTRWRRLRTPLLVLTLAVCLGILVWFKYAGFLADSILGIVNRLTGGEFSFERTILLPIGISFYTFQTLSYVIDVYRGAFPAERHLGYYALFVVFFPQLVAGPIECPGTLLPQLRAERRWTRNNLSAGGRLLLVGFFQKCVVADFCGVFVNRVFAAPDTAGSLAVFGAGLLFCVQMYGDFCGYSLIAAGSARLLGIRLTKNFDRPYLSRSYTEFFHRWHISLNRWFTQYVYIPLGGSRKGAVRRVINTWIVFALCGLWHGANWTYVLWGLYAAFFVSLEGLLKQPATDLAARLRIPLKHPLLVLLRRCGMFLLFVPSAILFRAPSVGEAGKLLCRLFTAGGSVTASFAALGIGGPELIELVLFMVCMGRLAIWENQEIPAASTAAAGERRLVSAVLVLLIVALGWLSLLATEDAAGFAYFQF